VDRELLDLIADYVEARQLRRDWPADVWDPERDPDEIAARIALFTGSG
jgi:hypothetical protein